MDLDTSINDESFNPIYSSPPMAPIGQTTADESKDHFGLSSIEKSEAAAILATIPMNFPILTPPSDDKNVLALKVASLTGEGKSLTEFFIAISNQQAEIANKILEGWQRNIDEIAAYVQRLITSPQYLQLQEIRIHGDQKQGNVSGPQDPISANAAASQPNILQNSLERLRILDQIPPTATIESSDDSKNSTASLVIPLTAVIMAGGVLSLVGTEMATPIAGMSTNPFINGVQMIEKLQPMIPQLAVSDIVPLVNLMVMAPIYYRSFEEATNSFRNREAKNYVETAQNFAKDVIKMVGDPTFVSQTIVAKMSSSAELASDDQNHLSRMLKLVMLGTALSLLYSVDVGKVQNGKYGGIEPEEFRELLMGYLTTDPSRLGSTQDQLSSTLITLARGELAMLNVGDRTAVVEVLLNYLGNTHELDHMLDPAKVFHETLASSAFDHKAEALDSTTV